MRRGQKVVTNIYKSNIYVFENFSVMKNEEKYKKTPKLFTKVQLTTCASFEQKRPDVITDVARPQD